MDVGDGGCRLQGCEGRPIGLASVRLAPGRHTASGARPSDSWLALTLSTPSRNHPLPPSRPPARPPTFGPVQKFVCRAPLQYLHSKWHPSSWPGPKIISRFLSERTCMCVFVCKCVCVCVNLYVSLCVYVWICM